MNRAVASQSAGSVQPGPGRLEASAEGAGALRPVGLQRPLVVLGSDRAAPIVVGPIGEERVGSAASSSHARREDPPRGDDPVR